jgi:Neprosin activation peptide
MQEPPKSPRGHVHARNISMNNKQDEITHIQQLWAVSGEACPDGSIPIRRTKEEDIFRVRSVKRFGRKPVTAGVRRDSSSSGHEVIDCLIII